jgi:phosphotransferase system HPr-like phosphotransfer protein
MGVMRLGAGRGDVIRVIASGPDEEAAADALEAYVAGGGS